MIELPRPKSSQPSDNTSIEKKGGKSRFSSRPSSAGQKFKADSFIQDDLIDDDEEVTSSENSAHLQMMSNFSFKTGDQSWHAPQALENRVTDCRKKIQSAKVMTDNKTTEKK